MGTQCGVRGQGLHGEERAARPGAQAGEAPTSGVSVPPAGLCCPGGAPGLPGWLGLWGLLGVQESPRLLDKQPDVKYQRKAVHQENAMKTLENGPHFLAC